MAKNTRSTKIIGTVTAGALMMLGAGCSQVSTKESTSSGPYSAAQHNGSASNQTVSVCNTLAEGPKVRGLLDADTLHYVEAVCAYKKSDYAGASKLLSPLAQAGHSDAKVLLALMYELGQVPETDQTASAMWDNQFSDVITAGIASLPASAAGAPEAEAAQKAPGYNWVTAATQSYQVEPKQSASSPAVVPVPTTQRANKAKPVPAKTTAIQVTDAAIATTAANSSNNAPAVKVASAVKPTSTDFKNVEAPKPSAKVSAPTTTVEKQQSEVNKPALQVAQTTQTKLNFNFDQQPDSECRVVIGTRQIETIPETVQYWLTLESNKLMVHTSSDIDFSSPQLGIQFEGGSKLRFDEKIGSSSIAMKTNWLDKIQKPGAMKLYLAFKGNSDNRAVGPLLTSLEALKPSLDAYKNCTQNGSVAAVAQH